MRRTRKLKEDPAKNAAYEERIRISTENMRNEDRMIAEMEADGKKVIRRDLYSCRAVLVTPEILHLETKNDHSYYPNAVAELYEKWQKGNEAQ